MTLAELNGHLDLVQQLQKTEELIQGLWDAAVPGAQKLDGMPHAPGVNDKVGVLGAEIADMETQRDALKMQIAKSEETPSIEKYRLKLNAMQVGFITNLRKILEKGEDRALLISATGERGIFVTGGRNPGFKRVSEAWS